MATKEEKKLIALIVIESTEPLHIYYICVHIHTCTCIKKEKREESGCRSAVLCDRVRHAIHTRRTRRKFAWRSCEPDLSSTCTVWTFQIQTRKMRTDLHNTCRSRRLRVRSTLALFEQLVHKTHWDCAIEAGSIVERVNGQFATFTRLGDVTEAKERTTKRRGVEGKFVECVDSIACMWCRIVPIHSGYRIGKEVEGIKRN